MSKRYFNPFTEFGFHKIFGAKANQHLLIDFLNALLPLEHSISSIQLRQPPSQDHLIEEHAAVSDIYCQDSQGQFFVVEMQKAPHPLNPFEATHQTKEATLYPLHRLDERGIWALHLALGRKLKAFYSISLLDFIFEENAVQTEYLHEVKLKNQHNQVFYNNYTLYFIEVPKFKKTESELAEQLDYWLYMLKNMESLPEIPDKFKANLVSQVFELAEIEFLNEEDRQQYESSLNEYQNLSQMLEQTRKQSWEKGWMEGLHEGENKGVSKGEIKARLEISQQLLRLGLDVEKVRKITGLSATEISLLHDWPTKP